MTVKSRRSFGLILQNGLLLKQFGVEIAPMSGRNIEASVLLTEGNKLHLFHTVEALDNLRRAAAFRAVEKYVKKEMSPDKVLDVVLRSADGRDLCYITEDSPRSVNLLSRFYRRAKDRSGAESLNQFAGRYQEAGESRDFIIRLCERRLAEHNSMRARRNAGRITTNGDAEGGESWR